MAKKKAAEISAVAAGGANPLEPQVTQHPVKLTAQEAADYSFAVNVVKLNRAKAWVNQNAEALGNPKGAAQTAAIKDRYVAIGGLLAENQKATAPKKGKVKNMADED